MIGGIASRYSGVLWVWVMPCGTVSGREADFELTGTYSQRVPEGITHTHVTAASTPID